MAWVSERKDVLSGFFFLLTLGAYVRYVEKSEGQVQKSAVQAPEPRGEPDLATQHATRNKQHASRFTFHVSRFTPIPASAWYLFALLCFALGLMSKPMLVTVPFVLLLLDYWPLQRFRRAALGRLVAEKAPFLLLAAASSVVTFIVQQKGGAVSTSLSVGARIANALVSYVRYIGKMFWPDDLSVLYPHPGHWPVWQVIGVGGLAAGRFGGGDRGGAAAALPAGGVAVVLRHAGAGDRAGAGGHPIHGRPLHLPAADRAVHHAGVGDR